MSNIVKPDRLNYSWLSDLYLAGKSNQEIISITGYKRQAVLSGVARVRKELAVVGADNFTLLLSDSIVRAIQINKTVTDEFITEFVRLQIALDRLGPTDTAERAGVLASMVKLGREISNNNKNLIQPLIKMGVSSVSGPSKGTQYPDSSGPGDLPDLASLSRELIAAGKRLQENNTEVKEKK